MSCKLATSRMQAVQYTSGSSGCAASTSMADGSMRAEPKNRAQAPTRRLKEITVPLTARTQKTRSLHAHPTHAAVYICTTVSRGVHLVCAESPLSWECPSHQPAFTPERGTGDARTSQRATLSSSQQLRGTNYYSLS